jgi:hypothetical protein
MDLFGLLTGKVSYIDIVKQFIEKIFKHEARKFNCEPSDVKLIIYRDISGNIEIGTFSNIENEVVRMIPDKEAQEILMK